MNLKSAIESGKPIRRSINGFNPAYGKVVELPSGLVFAYELLDSGIPEAVTAPLSLMDLLAEDWIVKAEAREFWVGMVKIQSHMKEVRHLRAFELKDKPTTLTADGTPWILVKEVLDENS